MKKIISVILSVLMVMALGINAFALTALELKPGTPTAQNKIVLKDYCDFNNSSENTFIAQSNDGGKFYVPIRYNDKELKNIELIADGMTARLIDFNPETMEYPGYYPTFYLLPMDDPSAKGLTWEDAKEMAKTLGKQNKKTYQIVPEQYLYIAEFTVNANYGASFIQGNFEIRATDVESGNRLSTGKQIVIRDVVFFDYENVKSAAQYDYVLKLGDKGYSDYRSYKEGYLGSDVDYGATCIAKSAFRAVEGKKLSIELSPTDKLVMNVVAGQNSINLSNYFNVDKKAKTIKFGFYGSPIIAGNYSYEVNLGKNAYDLAEFFNLRMNETDVYTFYVKKDGTIVDSFVIDYAKQQSYDDIVLKITGKGSALTSYELTLDGSQIAGNKTPSASTSKPASGEVNPNTGAEVIFEHAIFKVLHGSTSIELH